MSDISSIITVLRDHNHTPPSHLKMVVDSIAQDFQKNTDALKNSRRITGIIDDLKEITKIATNLGVVLKKLHPQTSQVMGMGGDWPLPGQLPSMELDQIIDKSILADLSTDNENRESVGLIKDIFDLANLASSTREEIDGTWNIRREDGKLDVGGNESISSMTAPHPKLDLARSCEYILVSEFDAEITSNPSELFYTFFAAVFEYASDLDPESKGAGLERYVKQVVGESR